jgi:DUF2924 family protein
MEPSIVAEIERLRQLTTAALRVRYREVWGEESRSSNRQCLFRRIAWRLQARAEGDLSERTRRRAREIADDADLRLRAPQGFFAENPSHQARPAEYRAASKTRDGRLPVSGTVLTRQFCGIASTELVGSGQDIHMSGDEISPGSGLTSLRSRS